MMLRAVEHIALRATNICAATRGQIHELIVIYIITNELGLRPFDPIDFSINIRNSFGG